MMHEDMQHRLAERKPSTLLSVAPPDKQRAKRTVRSVARSAIVSSGKADTSDRETNFGAGGERRAHEMKGAADLTLSACKHGILPN